MDAQPCPVLAATSEAQRLVSLGNAYSGSRIAPLVACLRNDGSREVMAGALCSLEPFDVAQLAVEAFDVIAKAPNQPLSME